MAKNPAWQRALTSLGSDQRTLDDIHAFFEALAKGDDRTAALLAATQVEDAVFRLLLHKMRDDLSTDHRNRLFGDSAPLGTHGSRIRLAYALGCFGPITYNDLDIIRRIRNAFAHAPRDINFNTDAVKDACNLLKMPEISEAIYISEGFAHRRIDTPRKRYISACEIYESALISPSARHGLSDLLPLVPLD